VFEFYKKSAEGGDTNAKFYLGYCYVNGIETEVDKEKGFELYNEAAGSKYDNDEVINHLDKVNHWYQKAAEEDNKLALYKLGELYEPGQGIHQNLVRAFEFTRNQPICPT